MLVWVDTETTGLEHEKDLLLEVGMTITTDTLKVVDSAAIVIAQRHTTVDALRDLCDPAAVAMHDKSGLWNEVAESHFGLAEAEQHMLDWLEARVPQGEAPMCGSSVLFDRRFLHHWMPQLEAHFHYRNIDVSTVKELVRRRYGAEFVYEKQQGRHRTLADLRDTLAELRYYLERFWVDAPY